MIKLNFWKCEATGNDFVVIHENQYSDGFSTLAQKLCERRFGIGADGLIVICDHKDYDFEMKYFNQDGSGPVMCGNGARASLLYVNRNIAKKEKYNFLAPDGSHKGKVEQDKIGLSMQSSKSIDTIKEEDKSYFTNTGVPHIVIQKQNIDDIDLEKLAPPLRKKYDANVNLIEQISEADWKIRTYERGVEGETLACGTGVTAAAIVIVEEFGSQYPVNINTKGGPLQVRDILDNNWLFGPAQKVFEGEIEI